MKNKQMKYAKLIGTILGIISFTALIAGITYALYIWISSNINITGESSCFTINRTKGDNISLGLNTKGIILFDESTIINDGKITIKDGMALTNFTASIDSACTIKGKLIATMTINNLSPGFINTRALKYALVSYDPNTYPTVNSNALLGQSFAIIKNESITSTNAITLIEENLSTTEKGYLVIFYVDGELADNSVEDATFSGTITATATQKGDSENAADYITKLYTNYSSKVTASNNSINYYYADIYDKDDNNETSGGLMNDRLGGVETLSSNTGNIRYYGANPNNYVDIGDINANGDPILYRIIGVFKDIELADGTKKDLVKVIRNDSIGDFSWDSSSSNVNNGYGINQWGKSGTYMGADLMKLLNPGYGNNIDSDSTGSSIFINNSLYYNSESGTCYSAGTNATTTCDFTNIGLSSNAHNKIETVKWNLGGTDDYYAFADALYEHERGTNVIQNPTDGIIRTTDWIGKIALMYPSDYGYATDFTKCTSIQPSGYSNQGCYDNDFLHKSSTQWVLTPVTSSYYNNDVWYVFDYGSLYYGFTTTAAVHPTFYLSSDAGIVSGSGLEGDPYVIQ